MKTLMFIPSLLVAVALYAQQYSIDGYKTFGGGGTSTWVTYC